MYWNDVVFLFTLLSSLTAWLCKPETKLPLDFCITKSNLFECPVYIFNLVGIPVMWPVQASSTGCMLSRKRLLFSQDHQMVTSESWIKMENMRGIFSWQIRKHIAAAAQVKLLIPKRSIVFPTLEWQPADFHVAVLVLTKLWLIQDSMKCACFMAKIRTNISCHLFKYK